MCPDLATFDVLGRHFVIRAYGTAMCLAVLTVVAVGYAVARRRGIPRRPALLTVVLTAFCFPAGSRLFYWMLHADARGLDLERLFEPAWNGFYLPGGLMLAALVSLVLSRCLRSNWWRLADSLAPGLALGSAVMRLGCFLNGCCFGVETSLPWGVAFPVASPAHTYQADRRFDALFDAPRAVHPTQLYELAAALIAGMLAVWLLRRRLPDGVAITLGLTCFLCLRWPIHGLRASTPLSGTVAFHALHAGAILIAAVFAYFRFRRYQATP